jgi:phytoene dehydrogenase-like protein
MSYDVIVIGGGHNGLVAAGTLGRGGLKVLVLEKRAVLGGRIATEEVWPGYRVSPALHSVGQLRPRVMRELGVDLKVVPHDPVVLSLLPDGRYLSIWRDAKRTAQELEKLSKKDAQRYPAYSSFMDRLTAFATPILDMAPPPLDAADLPQLFDVAQLGIRFRMLGKSDMMAAMRLGPMCVADLMGEWFETDALKATLAAPALWGLPWGPWAAGTGATLVYQALDGPLGTPKGGTGALATALAKACKTHGVTIRTGVEVKEILLDGSRVAGVRLADGESILASTVFSSLDPKRTFQKLVRPTALEPAFARQVRAYQSRGVTGHINLAVQGWPDFTCLKGLKPAAAQALLGGRIHIGPGLDYLEKAADEVKYGRYARDPMVEMVIPTLADASLAPAGHHILSLQVQWAPYHLREGQWDDVREQWADDVLNCVEAYVPGLSNRIVQRQIMTPLDLERSIGLTEGHVHHGEHSLNQLFVSRPVPALAQFASPFKNLYMCGAGAHPGGGITGAAGSNAAHAVLDERRTPAERAREAARPVAQGLAVLGAGLAVGMAIRALTRKNDKET